MVRIAEGEKGLVHLERVLMHIFKFYNIYLWLNLYVYIVTILVQERLDGA